MSRPGKPRSHEDLRSHRWFGVSDLRSFGHRSRAMQVGYDAKDWSDGATAVLRGNLAPDGCVMKPAACDPRFLAHAGPALGFDSHPDMKEAVEDEALDVTPDHVLVLRNVGPRGGPGMPEWGRLPIPRKLVSGVCATCCVSRMRG